MIKVFLNALADAYEVTGAKEIIDGSIRGQDGNADRSSGKFLMLCQPSHEMSTHRDNVRYECNRTYGCDAPSFDLGIDSPHELPGSSSKGVHTPQKQVFSFIPRDWVIGVQTLRTSPSKPNKDIQECYMF